jgi:CRP-like cAMP-binding protein
MAAGGLKNRALEDLSVRHRRVQGRHDIISHDKRPQDMHLITSGFAYRYTQLQNGGRQITGFLIPGDLCDLSSWCSDAWITM